MPFGVDAGDTNEMASSIANDALFFDVKDNIDSVTQDFLQAVLAKNPRDRPTLEEIKTHPYFNGMWVFYLPNGYAYWEQKLIS
jgi:serine/threonine protein kinase